MKLLASCKLQGMFSFPGFFSLQNIAWLLSDVFTPRKHRRGSFFRMSSRQISQTYKTTGLDLLRYFNASHTDQAHCKRWYAYVCIFVSVCILLCVCIVCISVCVCVWEAELVGHWQVCPVIHNPRRHHDNCLGASGTADKGNFCRMLTWKINTCKAEPNKFRGHPEISRTLFWQRIFWVFPRMILEWET